MLIHPKDFEHKYEDQRRERAYCEAAVQRGELSKEDAEKICADHRFAPVFMGPISEFCFFCGNKLTIPCIMWHGNTGDEIYMHPSCTELLIQGLTSDIELYKNEL